MLPTASRGRRALLVLAMCLIAPSGCGGTPGAAGGSQKREGKVGAMNVVLTARGDPAPELDWHVTNRVVATVDSHVIEVSQDQATLDGKSKPLGKGVAEVAIEYENKNVTIQADGKPIFGPSAK